MSRYNMHISMSQAFKNELWPFIKDGTPAVTFPEINNIDPLTVEFFNNIYDADAVERLYKEWNAAGRTYKLWSFYSNKPEGQTIIRADIDMLNSVYPQDFSGMGAWAYDTGQEVGSAQGEVWYPVPPQYINFMPDIMTDPGDPEAEPPVPPTYAPATDPADVVLLFGQAPRVFDSYYE
jgi:hypothetical protein